MQRCLCSCALFGLIASFVAVQASAQTPAAPPKVLPGTQPLEMEGDITSALVDGVDRFLLKQLDAAEKAREQHWPSLVHRAADKPHPLATELATMIGLRDARVANPRLTIERDPQTGSAYAATSTWQADLARWPVHADVDATGLYVRPKQGPDKFRAIVIPDAMFAPEHLVSLYVTKAGIAPWGAQLAAAGGEVIVTTPVSRQREARKGRAIMTDQEYLYRSAFELGRHVLGYQVNETLAAIDALSGTSKTDLPTIVIGWGEAAGSPYTRQRSVPRLMQCASRATFNRGRVSGKNPFTATCKAC